MRWLLALLALVQGLSVGAAKAQPRYELVWTAPVESESCPGEGAIAAEIAVRLGRNPFTHGSGQELAVTLSGAPGRWTASLSVRQPDGTVMWSRPLHSQELSCYTLANAIVLTVVLMIDPGIMVTVEQGRADPAVSDPVSDPDFETATDEVVDEVEEPATPVETVPPAPNPRRNLGASASVVLSDGLLPRVAGGVRVGVSGTLVGPLRWGVGMRFYPEVNTADDDFAFGLTALSISLCADVALGGRVLLGGCVAPQVGAIHGVVFNPEPTFPGDRLWVGLALKGQAAVRMVGPLWVGLEFGGVFSLLRQTFTIRAEPTPVFQQALFGLDGALSLSIRFL